VLLATVLGSAVAQLTATVVNVALPAIGREFAAGVTGLQWVVNGYMLALASLILIGGSLGDRYGRRRLFLVGTVWFTVASVVCAIAPTLPLLVGARVLQGIGGALLTPGSLAIIQATFVRADRAQAIGAWAALGGVAAAIGPAVGGWLVQSVSWRAVFLLNVPLAVVAVFAAARHVPESRDTGATGRLDVTGAGLGALGLAGLTYGFIEAGSRGPTSGSVLVALLIGVAALVGFVIAERRRGSPMLPLGIFSSRQFTYANLLTFVVYAALGVLFFLLVVYLQEGLGYSAVAAGVASLPVTAIMLVLSARGGALAERIGPRLPLTFGPLLIACGFGLLSRLGPEGTYATTVLPGLIVLGLGLAGTVAPVTATVLAAADERHSGVASGVNNAVARTASLLSVAVVPALVGLSEQDYADPAAFTDSFRAAMFLVGGLAASGGVLAFFTISNDVLDDDGGAGDDRGSPATEPERHPYHCAVDGPPADAIAAGHDGGWEASAATPQDFSPTVSNPGPTEQPTEHRNPEGHAVDEKDIIGRINQLVEEEDRLRDQGGSLDQDEGKRVDDIEVALDQCWDLLRQRRARKEFDEDPEATHVRDESTVEGYVQ
jgi:EmrB/QacA subfamily drug resistance transporter